MAQLIIDLFPIRPKFDTFYRLLVCVVCVLTMNDEAALFLTVGLIVCQYQHKCWNARGFVLCMNCLRNSVNVVHDAPYEVYLLQLNTSNSFRVSENRRNKNRTKKKNKKSSEFILNFHVNSTNKINSKQYNDANFVANANELYRVCSLFLPP